LIVSFRLDTPFIIRHASHRKSFCSSDCDSIIIKKRNKSS